MTASPRRQAVLHRTGGLLLLPATVAFLLIVLPLVGLFSRMEWTRLGEHLASPTLWPAIRLSLVTTAVTVALSMLFGTPLAWVIARAPDRTAGWIRSLVTVPVVLPPVVGGVALLLIYGRHGFVGGPLEAATGLRLPFTPYAVVLAQLFVSMPFYVLAVEGALRGADPRLLEVASTLGASPTRVFFRVGVPLAAPGVVAGAVLAWARALGEFGATITFAGNFSGTTQTAPLAVYVALQESPQAAVTLSLVMLVLSVGILAALRGRWLR
ncbi:MAG: molybdate ABC transporter permease subunit [Tetrasphaera sp.]|nr:molybdate ABC transporter permease subunit [Tetrasphaera sp.]